MRMTAESGEIWCAWRSTSMPSMFGILMSVTITSYKAPSSFLFACSPELAVSTLWPSRRSAISSISQMERSSSQTRMLPTRSSHGCDTDGFERRALCLGGYRLRPGQSRVHRELTQTQHKHASLPQFGAGKHLAFVSLNNLVYDGQSQPGTPFELRLKRLEYFFDELRTHSRPRIGKIKQPVFSTCFQRNRESASRRHGSHCVFAEIPKDLFE